MEVRVREAPAVLVNGGKERVKGKKYRSEGGGRRRFAKAGRALLPRLE